MNFRPGLSFGLLVAGLLLVPAAYFSEGGGSRSDDPPAAPRGAGSGIAEPLAASAPGKGQVGSPAPAFALASLSPGAARKASLEDYAGRVVLLDFWATWCAPCKRTLPHLAGLAARHADLAVLAVSLDEDKAKAGAFLARIRGKDTALAALHDEGRKAAESYDLAGMPAAVLIDRGGVVRARYDGYTEGDLGRMEAEVRKLLGEKP